MQERSRTQAVLVCQRLQNDWWQNLTAAVLDCLIQDYFGVSQPALFGWTIEYFPAQSWSFFTNSDWTYHRLPNLPVFLSKFCKICRLNRVNPSRNRWDILKNYIRHIVSPELFRVTILRTSQTENRREMQGTAYQSSKAEVETSIRGNVIDSF